MTLIAKTIRHLTATAIDCRKQTTLTGCCRATVGTKISIPTNSILQPSPRISYAATTTHPITLIEIIIFVCLVDVLDTSIGLFPNLR